MKAALEKACQFNAETSQRLIEIEQRLVAPNIGGGNYAKSWGLQIVESDQFKSLQQSRSGRAFIELKTTITTGSTSGGPLAPSDRRPDVDMLPQRRVRIRDLVSPGRTNSTAVEYPQQTTRTISAAPTAEEGTKPESALAWEWKNAPVRTIAHWIPASKQIFDDAPQLMSLVGLELTYGLADVEEQQLLSGSGVGEDLDGLYNQASAFVAPFVPPPRPGSLTKIDILRMGDCTG